MTFDFLAAQTLLTISPFLKYCYFLASKRDILSFWFPTTSLLVGLCCNHFLICSQWSQLSVLASFCSHLSNWPGSIHVTHRIQQKWRQVHSRSKSWKALHWRFPVCLSVSDRPLWGKPDALHEDTQTALPEELSSSQQPVRNWHLSTPPGAPVEPAIACSPAWQPAPNLRTDWARTTQLNFGPT